MTYLYWLYYKIRNWFRTKEEIRQIQEELNQAWDEEVARIMAHLDELPDSRENRNIKADLQALSDKVRKRKI